MTTYRIKDWNKVFEDYRSREVAELEFVKWPVRRSSEAFYMLARTADGMIAFGVFAMLVQWAARCPLRGTLRDERGPVTPERFADRYGMPIKVARKAFATLTDRECGWLEITDGAPTEHRPSTGDGSVDRTDEPPTKHHPNTDGAPTLHRPYATSTKITKTTTAAAATKTLPTPLTAEPAAAAAGISPLLQALHDRGIGEPTASSLIDEGVTGADISAVERASDAGDGPGLWVHRLREAIAQRAATAQATEARQAARAAFDALDPSGQHAKLLEFRVWAQDNGLECRHMPNQLVAKWAKFTEWLIAGGAA